MGLARSFHMFLQGIFFWQTMNSSKWYWSKVLLKKHWACSFKPGPTIVQPLKLEKSLCNSKRGYVTWRDVVWLKERLLDFMEVAWLDERLLDLSRGCMSWGEITSGHLFLCSIQYLDKTFNVINLIIIKMALKSQKRYASLRMVHNRLQYDNEGDTCSVFLYLYQPVPPDF